MKEELIEIIEAIPLKKLSRGEKTILKVMLIWGNNETKNIGISLADFVKFTGFSERGIIYMISKLSEKNLIFVKKQRGEMGDKTNLYAIQTPNLRKLYKLKSPKKSVFKSSKDAQNSQKKLSTPPPAICRPSPPAICRPSPYINVITNNNQILNSTVVKQTKNLNLKKTSKFSEPEELQMLVDQYGEQRVQSVMSEAKKKRFHIRNMSGWVSRALHERWKFENESDRIEEGKH